MHRGRFRGLARAGAGAVAAAVVLLWASPAFATTGRIDGFSTLPDGHLGVAFSAVGLAKGETIDLSSVKVTVAGQDVPASAQLVSQAQAPQKRATMLTIDLSGSMAQTLGTTSTTRIDAAKQAADTYLAGVPSDVAVGIVTFADAAKVALAPTQDHGKVKQVIDSLTAPPNGSTALYDAVVLANGALASQGAGVLKNQLLLTDGKNEPGPNAVGNTQATAVASLKATNVTLDAVSIGSDAQGLSELTALTTAGGGAAPVSADNADSLTAIFATAANDQANAILVDVTVPPNLAGTSQTVAVTASAGGQTIGDNAVGPMPATVTAVPSDLASQYGPVPVAAPASSITSQSWFLPAAVAAVGVGLFVLLAVAFLASDRENQTSGRVRRRLSRYSLTSRDKKATAPTSGALGDSQVARSAVELAGRVTQSRDLDTRLALKLDAAGIPLKAPEWMIIHLGIAIGAALVLTLLTGFNIMATILGLVVGLLVPFAYLSIKEDRRKKEFATRLPETLQLLSGSLAAGYSLPQAVDTVVRESTGPMASELNRALVEARLGVPMEDALETVAQRMDSVDFAWVVMAIRIQREVGGNLAEVLSNVAATMRERERLRRQVQVLSAEGRLSAIILGALPLVFVSYLVLVRPEYIGTLITNPLGIVMIVVGVVLLVGGGFWLRKVVEVEV